MGGAASFCIDTEVGGVGCVGTPGAMAGGDKSGRPAVVPLATDVVTAVMSVAIVGGDVPTVTRSSELLITEAGGLLGFEPS